MAKPEELLVKELAARHMTIAAAESCTGGYIAKRLTDVPQDPNDPRTRVPLEQMKKIYYQARGWDKSGIPTCRTLKKLKIAR